MAKFASKSNADGFRLDRIVLSELPADAYKIYATASARVYHTQFGASDQDWTYTRLKGILVFGRDRSAQGSPVSSISHPSPDADRFWFRLVDEISGKVVWMIKVPKVLDYQVDRPFFHVFPGRVCCFVLSRKYPDIGSQSRMFGFRFEDDDEAKALSQKVIDRIGPKGD
jgi:Wiskott-Aldrich syndrome protein